MASKFFVYSTLTSPQRYTNYKFSDEKGIPPQVEYEILIEGGANLADRFQITVPGTRTEITERDYDALKRNLDFQNHVKRGFIVVREQKVDPEIIVADNMKQKDASAPITPQDYAHLVGKEGMAVPQELKAA